MISRNQVSIEFFYQTDIFSLLSPLSQALGMGIPMMLIPLSAILGFLF